MTALTRRSNRSYFNRMFQGVVGSFQRESALKQPIMMAAFVTTEVGAVFSTNSANKHHGYVFSN